MTTTIESLDARVIALESKLEAQANTAIARVFASLKARAPAVIKAAATVGAGYAVAKFDLVSFVLKHLA